jgi:hypothetical protein
MSRDDRRLVRHLALAVLAKLLVLLGLWWAFFHDAREPVDAEGTASHLGAVPPPAGASK